MSLIQKLLMDSIFEISAIHEKVLQHTAESRENKVERVKDTVNKVSYIF